MQFILREIPDRRLRLGLDVFLHVVDKVSATGQLKGLAMLQMAGMNRLTRESDEDTAKDR